MEVTRNIKVIEKFLPDVRQSDRWMRYLEFLGWYSKKTESGVNIALRKTPFGALVKIQRPGELTEARLAEIEEACAKENALFIKIEPDYGQDEKILREQNYIKSYFPLIPTRTMIMDLSKSEPELWNALSKSAKYSLHRSEREGDYVKIFKNPGEEVLKPYYEMHLRTGRRKKFYIQPFKDLQKKVELFGDDLTLVLVYNVKNELMSGKFYLNHNGHVLYLHGGTSDVGRKTKAGYLLAWKSTLYFKEQGYKTLDLEGLDDKRFPMTTTDWGGFSHFKEKFGGEIIEFPGPCVKYLHPMLTKVSKFLPQGFGL